MRQPDINRIKKAEAHLDAARTVLDSIKWENVNSLVYDQLQDCKKKIQSAKWHLQDALTV